MKILDWFDEDEHQKEIESLQELHDHTAEQIAKVMTVPKDLLQNELTQEDVDNCIIGITTEPNAGLALNGNGIRWTTSDGESMDVIDEIQALREEIEELKSKFNEINTFDTTTPAGSMIFDDEQLMVYDGSSWQKFSSNLYDSSGSEGPAELKLCDSSSSDEITYFVPDNINPNDVIHLVVGETEEEKFERAMKGIA